jgi:hypothetical protein
VITDSEGQASIEFNRIFYSQLTIRLASEPPKTKALFRFDRKDIKEDTTLTQIGTEYFSSGEERGEIKLLLEVGNWSLGSAQVSTVEE